MMLKNNLKILLGGMMFLVAIKENSLVMSAVHIQVLRDTDTDVVNFFTNISIVKRWQVKKIRYRLLITKKKSECKCISYFSLLAFLSYFKPQIFTNSCQRKTIFRNLYSQRIKF